MNCLHKEFLRMSFSAARSSLVESLAETMGTKAHVQTIYGSPIERDGLTIIPVGKIRYGLGGASGYQKKIREGSGGGGGMVITPVGYIETKKGKSKFKRIHYPAAIFQIMGGLVFSVWIILREIRMNKVSLVPKGPDLT
jgi:uncharacterized spore protein YtfJ